MEAKIRQNQDILKISGKALIILGLWTIIRIFLLKFLDPELLNSFLAFPTSEYFDASSYGSMFVFVIVVLVVDLIFRFVIGGMAISEGNGKKRSVVYIILAILYTISSLGGNAFVVINLSEDVSVLTPLSSVLIDLTSCLALIAIIVSSISIRVLMKKAEKTE